MKRHHHILVEIYPISSDKYGAEITFSVHRKSYLMITTESRSYTEEELVEEYGEHHRKPGDLITGVFPAVFSPSKPLQTVEEAVKQAETVITRHKRPEVLYRNPKVVVYDDAVSFYTPQAKRHRFSRRLFATRNQ